MRLDQADSPATGLSMIRKWKSLCFVVWLLTVCLLLVVSLRYNHHMAPPPPPTSSPVTMTTARPIQTVQKYDIDCSHIYDMDPVEIGKSLIIREKKIVADDDENLIKLTLDCSLFTKVRGYDDVCVSAEEKDFPIAYSLVVHKLAWMVERLIKATYSPNNIYCIHYDRKSSIRFILAMEGLARCLPNVFIASKIESVYYASFSRLKADLNCLSDLMASDVRWRYVINLCGQDLPLRSNVELVSELRKLKGANMLETSRPSEYKKQRFAFHHELQDASENEKFPVRTEKKKTPPPHGIEVFIGNAYFVLSREFIFYLNSSQVVKDFLSWSEDTYSPDEHFWATMTRLPGVPGEVPRSKPDITDLMSKTRLVKWGYLEPHLYPKCTGQHVRSVCIYGSGELRWLLNYGHWFANKFNPSVDPVVIQCLEEKLQEKQKTFTSVSSPNCRTKRRN